MEDTATHTLTTMLQLPMLLKNHTPTTPTVVEPSILSRNVKPKLNQKPKLIQMLGMDTDTDHTGDTDTDLLTIIHTHTDTMDTMVDTVDTTTENRLLQYKYRMWLPQKRQQTISKMSI